MKDKTKMIKALRDASDLVEKHGGEYEWQEQSRCNCGLVACSIIGISHGDLKSRLKLDMYEMHSVLTTWSDMASDEKNSSKRNLKTCVVTGRSVSEIFDALYEAGFSYRDFNDLEFMKNGDVLKRAGIMRGFKTDGDGGRVSHYQTPENFVKYCRAWADMLCEQQQKEMKGKNHEW